MNQKVSNIEKLHLLCYGSRLRFFSVLWPVRFVPLELRSSADSVLLFTVPVQFCFVHELLEMSSAGFVELGWCYCSSLFRLGLACVELGRVLFTCGWWWFWIVLWTSDSGKEWNLVLLENFVLWCCWMFLKKLFKRSVWSVF